MNAGLSETCFPKLRVLIYLLQDAILLTFYLPGPCECVARIIVMPYLLFTSSRRFPRFSAFFESSEPVGSSARRIDGLFTSARTRATLWASPPEILKRILCFKISVCL